MIPKTEWTKITEVIPSKPRRVIVAAFDVEVTSRHKIKKYYDVAILGGHINEVELRMTSAEDSRQSPPFKATHWLRELPEA